MFCKDVEAMKICGKPEFDFEQINKHEISKSPCVYASQTNR